MNKHDRSDLTAPILISFLALFGTALVLRSFFNATYFVPFLMLAYVLLLPTVLSMVALLFCKAIPVPAQSGKTATADTTKGQPAQRAAHAVRRRLLAVGGFLRHWALVGYNRARPALRLLLLFGALVLMSLRFFTLPAERIISYQMGLVYPVGLTVLFVLFVILEKWLRHTASSDPFAQALAQNLRSAMAFGRVAMLLLVLSCVLKSLQLYDAQQLLIVLLILLFCYQLFFLVISLVTRLVRQDLSVAPHFVLPLPFTVRKEDDLGFVNYLESSTGITMRSLWSIKLIRHILPYTVIAVALCLWLSSGIVQIGSDQQGAVYRLGVLQEEKLGPGLHITLPAPFDEVRICETEKIRKMTIGYRAESVEDNIWTAAHGDEEYKLLLGGGNELVSINLRLEYKISSLHDYLTASAAPEQVLQALAYELVTDRTITTDLNTLLSVDRAAFAGSFGSELAQKAARYGIGLEIVSVVLESIHPPVEIAQTYQEMVSAEIQAEQLIQEAHGTAARTLADANIDRALMIADNKAAYYNRVAEATSSVAEFMAAVSADTAYSDAYRYNKYLSAVRSAYNNARIVIVGDGVDTKHLYFGSIVIG